jgi:hypothetical protein
VLVVSFIVVLGLFLTVVNIVGSNQMLPQRALVGVVDVGFVFNSPPWAATAVIAASRHSAAVIIFDIIAVIFTGRGAPLSARVWCAAS